MATVNFLCRGDFTVHGGHGRPAHSRNTKIQIRDVKNTDFGVKIQTTLYMPYKKGHVPVLCKENTTKCTSGSYANHI